MSFPLSRDSVFGGCGVRRAPFVWGFGGGFCASLPNGFHRFRPLGSLHFRLGRPVWRGPSVRGSGSASGMRSQTVSPDLGLVVGCLSPKSLSACWRWPLRFPFWTFFRTTSIGSGVQEGCTVVFWDLVWRHDSGITQKTESRLASLAFRGFGPTALTVHGVLLGA